MPKDAKRLIRTPGRSDIYTLLMVIAILALAIGIGFVWHRGSTLFDAGHPFDVVSVPPSGQPATPHP